MDIHHAIARWESEGGAVPQVETPQHRFKALQLRQILVPIDFSPESLKTLRSAKRLAEEFGAKLHLVHVVIPPPLLLPRRTSLPPNFSEELVAEASRRLREVATEFSLPVRSKPYSVRQGEIADEISKEARATRAELIAIATRGHTGIKRAFLGSTTENVVRDAACPVLVVREKEQSSRSQRARKESAPQFRKILVPLDFSEASRLGLEYALGFAQEFHATVVLFHSVFVSGYVLATERSASQIAALITRQQDYATAEMEKLRKTISAKGGKVETRLGLGAPAEQITNYVAKSGVDLIITSTHGRSGLHRVFMGSTAARVLRYASCSVLVVPNRASRAKAGKGR
jgi:nucleotide-binding universal stress UspA family protein